VRPIVHFLLWKAGLTSAETQTSAAERDCLARHAADKRVVVEIGSWHGVTTSRLRGAMSEHGVLYAIDPYPVGRLRMSLQMAIAKAEVAKSARGSVKWVRRTGADAAAEHAASKGPPVELMFIDGDHTYEGLRGDWEGWSPLIAPGGIVAMHDSRSSQSRSIDSAGSAIYTREVILRDPAFEQVEFVDTLTVVRRKLAV
jgi:predicted O-methyltransferase YrrM